MPNPRPPNNLTKKGADANPNGRPKYTGEWRDMLRKVLHEEDKHTRLKRMHRVARALVRAAEGGDVAAIREIGDRIDGKAMQPHELGGNLGHTVYHIVTGVPREDEDEAPLIEAPVVVEAVVADDAEEGVAG